MSEVRREKLEVRRELACGELGWSACGVLDYKISFLGGFVDIGGS
jgi:hypothetical protein